MFLKRFLDIVFSIAAIVLLFWLFIIVAILVRVRLGSPIIFKQPRPGKKDKNGKEKIFCLYKFRTMTNESDEEGNPLPDDVRMTPFGKTLRTWSLDELPELFNILKGDMSFVGPRPQLVRDMTFMSEDQRRRHNVRPGLTGLAQISGRNAISWEQKLWLDLDYLENRKLIYDFWIVFRTIKTVIEHEGLTSENKATSEDYGDVLLAEGRITKEEYDAKQEEARELLREAGY